MSNVPLSILYEDNDLIAVNKPSGLLTHPSWLTKKGTANIASMIKDHLKGEKVHTVHRLDRATSGVLLVAKNKFAAQQLSKDFSEHNIEKTYLCVVRGYAPESGVIDKALKYQPDKQAEAFADVDAPAQEAVTHFERLACVELPIAVGKWPCARYSLVRAMPKTGRKHQLRRHFKHLLCPIVGDTNYGEGRHNKLFRDHFDSHRLLLMATKISFYHPVTRESMIITAPMEPEVRQLFERFNWRSFIV